MEYIKNWFSNMLLMDEPYLYQDIYFYTSENFYQAMKIDKSNKELRKYIASLKPHAAKREIRNHKWRDSWDKPEALKVMNYILRIKFAKNTTWAEKLLATNNEPIVEFNNWNDTYWGVSVSTNKGSNHLGLILMAIRDELKVEPLYTGS
jgi:ribA/ribD-fused uncharacterized protein